MHGFVQQPIRDHFHAGVIDIDQDGAAGAAWRTGRQKPFPADVPPDRERAGMDMDELRGGWLDSQALERRFDRAYNRSPFVCVCLLYTSRCV